MTLALLTFLKLLNWQPEIEDNSRSLISVLVSSWSDLFTSVRLSQVLLSTGSYVVFVVYTVHIVNVFGEEKIHQPLSLVPDAIHNFCMFSVVFSQDNKELLGGSVSALSAQACLKKLVTRKPTSSRIGWFTLHLVLSLQFSTV